MGGPLGLGANLGLSTITPKDEQSFGSDTGASVTLIDLAFSGKYDIAGDDFFALADLGYEYGAFEKGLADGSGMMAGIGLHYKVSKSIGIGIEHKMSTLDMTSTYGDNTFGIDTSRTYFTIDIRKSR